MDSRQSSSRWVPWGQHESFFWCFWYFPPLRVPRTTRSWWSLPFLIPSLGFEKTLPGGTMKVACSPSICPQTRTETSLPSFRRWCLEDSYRSFRKIHYQYSWYTWILLHISIIEFGNSLAQVLTSCKNKTEVVMWFYRYLVIPGGVQYIGQTIPTISMETVFNYIMSIWSICFYSGSMVFFLSKHYPKTSNRLLLCSGWHGQVCERRRGSWS